MWTTQTSLTEQIELLRIEATGRLAQDRRSELGQFLTPAPIARLMGTMLPAQPRQVHILDAGAGVGSLLAAGVETLVHAAKPPSALRVTAYEIDPLLRTYLDKTLQLCRTVCADQGIAFHAEVIEQDFIVHAVERLASPLLYPNEPQFTCAILNPPYRKIRSNSTLVDSYVRQFSGHTQINATDLRTLRYPHAAQLRAIGRRTMHKLEDQLALDTIIAEELTMADIPDDVLRRRAFPRPV